MPSICSETTFTTTMAGTHNSMPQTPHHHAPNNKATKTANAFILAIRPVIHVATSMPTKVAIPSVTTLVINMEVKDSNCRKAAKPMATAAIRDPHKTSVVLGKVVSVRCERGGG